MVVKHPAKVSVGQLTSAFDSRRLRHRLLAEKERESYHPDVK